jgi:hypothetical protein
MKSDAHVLSARVRASLLLVLLIAPTAALSDNTTTQPTTPESGVPSGCFLGLLAGIRP